MADFQAGLSKFCSDVSDDVRFLFAAFGKMAGYTASRAVKVATNRNLWRATALIVGGSVVGGGVAVFCALPQVRELLRESATAHLRLGQITGISSKGPFVTENLGPIVFTVVGEMNPKSQEIILHEAFSSSPEKAYANGDKRYAQGMGVYREFVLQLEAFNRRQVDNAPTPAAAAIPNNHSAVVGDNA